MPVLPENTLFWMRTSVLSGKFVSLIRDGFSSSVRRATQQCREYFEVAQQSCRRKDARSSGVNFPDSALASARKKDNLKLVSVDVWIPTGQTIWQKSSARSFNRGCTRSSSTWRRFVI